MTKLRVPVTSEDHMLGATDAPITLVEYGDYQCPACGMAHPQIKRLMHALPRHVRLVFRNFPLTQVHEFAFLGAMGAEAASLQGRFWDMHDLIFENQELLGPDGIFELAGWLDLDLDRFERDLEDETLKTRIREQFMGGVRSGVGGTPGFFLNGVSYAGPLDPEVFRVMLRPLTHDGKGEYLHQ